MTDRVAPGPVDRPAPPEQTTPAYAGPGGRAWAIASGLVLGLVVGLVGTVAHRGVPPWGLLVAVAATLSAAVLARGVGEGAALAGYGGGLLLVTQLANGFRPGGDVLVAADGLGYAWLGLPLLMCGVAAFLPRRWFAEEDV